jgi:hypothetical protein
MSEIIPDGKMNAAAACYSFMGWLTCRDEVSGPFSSRHNAGEAARLVEKFCAWQDWKIEDERWFDHIKPYQEHNKPIKYRPILPHEEIQASEQRIQYRTSDGIIHLWTQGEIDAHIQSPYAVSEPAITVYDETRTTIEMLHDLLFHRNTPRLDHETVQDLLSRIDVLEEPLKAIVQALEVKV